MIYVFFTEEGKNYHGEAYYYRLLLKRNLNKEQIKKIFIELYRKFGNTLLALRYDTKTGIAVIFTKPTERLIPLAVILPLIALAGGVIIGYFVGNGKTDYEPEKIVGFNISIWDILKIGAVAFIISGVIKTIVDSYVALTKKEYVPTTPYQVFVEPIAKPITEAVKTTTQVLPYIIKR